MLNAQSLVGNSFKIVKTNQLFNVNLQHMLKETISYKLFNEAILRSAQQSEMTKNQSNKGWLHHSNSTLTPELAARNAILHSIRTDQHPPSQEKILNLKTLQQEVDKIIEIIKARW